MEITVDRDSVAAGDDTERHDYTVDVTPETTVDEVVPGRRSHWQWTDEAGPQEVRNWETPELAQHYAPFARWSVDEVVAHFTAASPM